MTFLITNNGLGMVSCVLIEQNKIKMEKLHGHTLEYWKNNAEEDYLKVPISVLKYITCLEERIEQLIIADVVGRSEQLLAFANYMCKHQNNLDRLTAKDYLKDFLSQ